MCSCVLHTQLKKVHFLFLYCIRNLREHICPCALHIMLEATHVIFLFILSSGEVLIRFPGVSAAVNSYSLNGAFLCTFEGGKAAHK
jgi:hypothetical protein